MRLRRLSSIAVVLATAAVAGVAVAAVALDGDDSDHAPQRSVPASEPLRKAPLLAPPQRSETDAYAGGAEAEEARAAQLGLPRPERFRVGTADRALAEFMAAWRQRRFGVMRTWTDDVAAPEAARAALRRRYGAWRIRGWRVRARRRIRERGAFEYELAVAFRTLTDPTLRRQRFRLDVVRRDADGSWGVDPVPAA